MAESKTVTLMDPGLTEENVATHNGDGNSDDESEDKVAPLDDSWRPKFIPRGYEKLNKDIYRNLFYSTSSADSFRSPMSHSKSSPLLLLKAKSKSVQNIHDPNRAAAEKEGGFQPNRAPLYQRSMCAYTTQFVPRPLDGALINKECYKLFKEKCETATGSGAAGGGKFRGETTTNASYPEYSRIESEKAIPPNFKPIQEKHVSSENKLLVTKSAAHKQFPCPSVQDTKTARPEAFKPKYKTHKSVGTMSAVSSYKRDFNPDKYNSVWPVRFARQPAPPPATTGYTGKVHLDEKADKKLIPEEFHIGDVLCLGST